MHRIRPTLKVGDVCRFNHKGQRKYRNMRNATLVVAKEPVGDSSEAYVFIACKVIFTERGSKHMVTRSIMRQYLWFTGHNKEAPAAPSSKSKRKSGRPCTCDMQTIMSSGCRCGGC